MNASSGAEVRQHILNIAKPIMLHKGFSAVGLNEILAAAGIPKGSFYHYFGSKEAFGEALLESYFEGYLEHLDNLLKRQPGTGAERLLTYWGNWLHTQCADDPEGKCLAVKLGAEVSDLSEAMRAVLRRGTGQIIERLAGGIEAALADGSLSGVDDPAYTAAILYELWLGATLLEKIHRDRKPLERAMVETRRLLNLPPAEHDDVSS
ncbi:TetR/AcrR family transcriptional regulator [Burkholderia dolosa]|jgi:TetR/AcrR family transcriptional repressor of nem operon|uniref:TetR/AcrR family transcriptional regulator n=1 Tax=Burkholderia dolosa TaxID=152500 RepID=A0A892IGV0_9BURK|nr:MULTISPECIES: TetR/AcrR family transcriptional regulator [Burkholderia]AKE05937.1 TetR family transcriptional regulator [Burkholderia cepacia]AJY09423.1 bacterial regulatory s, tetR family protein [Burkholderia dolosa AU0158]AYZ93731.1 TetR/AcrR family transcriptional regulator [Burkholderia dolosa]EAY70546.1 Transcriptional regulator [Burkholderia dolosa AU0158]ETP62549.1 TetR family transcriptional regulator [Burkholderia dolosa PC543]